MWRGIRINTDGSLATVELDDTTPSLQARSLNEVIGSDWYELVPFGSSLGIFVADEDGQRRSALNVELSVMARASGHGGVIFGPGVFLGVNHETGDTYSLTSEQVATVVAMWRRPRVPGEYDSVLASAGLALTA
jgi:hypothetical protein